MRPKPACDLGRYRANPSLSPSGNAAKLEGLKDMSNRYYNQGTVNPLSRVWNGAVKEALGVEPTKHWPDEGAQGEVNGVQIVVAAKGYTLKSDGTQIEAKSRMARRTFAACPTCSKFVCAGHLGQHMRSHKGA